MKSLNDLIWTPESNDICGDKHLASTVALVGDLCNVTPPQTLCNGGGVTPPVTPQSYCPSIGGPMIITCTGIMGSCGGGVITPQSKGTCGGTPPGSGFGCSINK